MSINTQLIKLKSTGNNQLEASLRATKKKFQSENLPHELSLSVTQETKVKHDLNDKLLTDIRPCKTQISKIVHLEEFFGTLLGKLTCPVMKMVLPLAKKILLPLKGR